MNLRDMLRSDTRDKHAALDATVGKLAPFDSTTAYSLYLSGMRELFQANAVSLDWCAQQIGLAANAHATIERLDRDLSSLAKCGGVLPPSCDPDAGSAPQTSAEHWGRAYVLEGSAMGTRVLIKRAKASLGQDSPLCFLTAAAEEATTRWPAFAEALGQVTDDSSSVVSAAMSVFEHADAIYSQAVLLMERMSES